MDVDWLHSFLMQYMFAFEVSAVILVLCISLALLLWMLTTGHYNQLEKGMGNNLRPIVQLSKRDKALVVDLLEDVIEERVLFKKLKRNKARELYKKIGLALDIPELVPPGEIKAIIKSRRRFLNGKPIVIPGEPPLQDVKPNLLKPVRSLHTKKANLSKFFSSPKAS